MSKRATFDQELALTLRFGKWMEEAKSIYHGFDASGLPIPARIRQVLDEAPPASQEVRNTDPVTVDQTSVAVAKRAHKQKPAATEDKQRNRSQKAKWTKPVPPNYGRRPEGAPSDWIPVPVEYATIGNLIAFILAREHTELSNTKIAQMVKEIRPETAESSIPMTVAVLEADGLIEGDFSGWKLTKPAGGKLVGDRLWTPLEQLRSFDRSAVRREAIQRVLEANRALPVSVIAACLNQCAWMPLPVTSDLIKADLRTMAKENLVTKVGIDWQLAKYTDEEKEEYDQQEADNRRDDLMFDEH